MDHMQGSTLGKFIFACVVLSAVAVWFLTVTERLEDQHWYQPCYDYDKRSAELQYEMRVHEQIAQLRLEHSRALTLRDYTTVTEIEHQLVELNALATRLNRETIAAWDRCQLANAQIALQYGWPVDSEGRAFQKKRTLPWE